MKLKQLILPILLLAATTACERDDVLVESEASHVTVPTFTDVDGFYTADPKKDPTATIMPRMTYQQALDMCQAGAKVIYAPTLSPVAIKHIPVWVKNTFNPQAPGTLID